MNINQWLIFVNDVQLMFLELMSDSWGAFGCAWKDSSSMMAIGWL
ncbi:hypothetical protein [Pseudomonas sp. GM80]|nr:hypothetical protein [Pseudomonas sp. GM80]